MKSQKILITGGSRGLGKELVVQFLDQDCEVHVVGRNSNSEIKSSKLNFIFWICSIRMKLLILLKLLLTLMGCLIY